jgi:hypothetical protein
MRVLSHGLSHRVAAAIGISSSTSGRLAAASAGGPRALPPKVGHICAEVVSTERAYMEDLLTMQEVRHRC